MELLADQGVLHLFLYTKCDKVHFFRDLGFAEIARVEGLAAFLENRRDGFARYLEELTARAAERPLPEGAVRGAIVMNAGAYDGETVDVLESVRWLDRRGNLHVAAGEELDMGYRHSRFSDEFGVIVDAVYRLRPGDTKAIEQRIDELTQKRWSKQPMEAASAGSTFKRPAGSFASKLIHESGLQGLRVGDAMVSEKHAGFLINAGEATCGEFLELVRQVQEKVESDSGIRLELEIRRPDATADAARDAALRRQAETEMEEGEEQED